MNIEFIPNMQNKGGGIIKKTLQTVKKWMAVSKIITGKGTTLFINVRLNISENKYSHYEYFRHVLLY